MTMRKWAKIADRLRQRGQNTLPRTQPPDLKRLVRRARLRLLIPGVVFATVGFVLLLKPDSLVCPLLDVTIATSRVLGQVALAAGIAFLVPVLLLFWYGDLENEAIARSIFRTVFGKYIDDGQIALIRDDLGSNPIVRRNARWDFYFAKNDGALTIAQHCQSKLENHGLRYALERPTEDITDDVHVKTYRIRYIPSGTMLEVEDEHDLHGGAVVEEEMHAKGCTTESRLFASQFTRTSIINLEINVHYPRELTVDVSPYFSSKPHDSTVDVSQDMIKRTLKVDHVLPYQGITLVFK